MGNCTESIVFPSVSAIKNQPAVQEMQEIWVKFLGWEHTLEEGIATHSSILAWRIPWTEEPGGLSLIGWQSVGHNQTDLAHRQAQLSNLWLVEDSGLSLPSQTQYISLPTHVRGIAD